MGGSIAHKLYGAIGIVQVCRDWPSWFLEYFAGSHDWANRVYRLRNGALLHTRRNRSDLRMIDEIWAFAKYDYFGYRVVEGELVVDIGANIGTFTVYAATVGKARRVIAFEPHPGNYAMLVKNVEANHLRCVDVANEAVSDSEGVAELEVSDIDCGSHRLRLEGQTIHPESRAVQVNTCTLPEIFERYKLDTIDYLKMDCEGGEFAIFAATPDRYLKRIRRISMETHTVPNQHLETIIEALRRNGFDVRTYDGHRLYARRTS